MNLRQDQINMQQQQQRNAELLRRMQVNGWPEERSHCSCDLHKPKVRETYMQQQHYAILETPEVSTATPCWFLKRGHLACY
jgi:hypothetical protein